MRYVLLSILAILAAASPAAAQSCATLGGPVNCGAASAKPAAQSPQPARKREPAPAEKNVQVQGSAETTISNHGVSTTLDSRVIDSHGFVEFGISGSTSTSCRAGQYRKPCD